MSRMPRLRIDRVQCAVENLVTTARVQLSYDGRAETGMASDRTVEGAWRHVVAGAALAAVRKFTDGRLDVTLDAVAEVHSGRHPLIVVTMAIGRSKHEVFLSGTAPVDDDRFGAVARAVLHGLNRWLEPLLPDLPVRATEVRNRVTSV